jgi:hypothetical protein
LHDVLCWIVSKAVLLLGYVIICASDNVGRELGVWSMLASCLEECRLCNGCYYVIMVGFANMGVGMWFGSRKHD